MNSVCQLISHDLWRMQLLTAVAQLDLPQAYIAAGFVRNCVWDALHGYQTSALNDVDVIFFDQSDMADMRRQQAMLALQSVHPNVNWQIKNQALMHIRNGDPAYSDCEDAMCYWPEQETAVAVRLNVNNQLELLAPFGVEGLLAGRITHNVRRDIHLFQQRVATKQWLLHWPQLQLCY